jgi:hypothetical protein
VGLIGKATLVSDIAESPALGQRCRCPLNSGSLNRMPRRTSEMSRENPREMDRMNAC